ncbi:hypothetical protein BH23ACT10_BH23ACT10_23120 [soil metagenome]
MQLGLLRTVRSYARELLDADPAETAVTIDRRDRYLAERVSHHGEMLLVELSDASAGWIRRHTDDLRAVLDSASTGGDAVLLVWVVQGAQPRNAVLAHNMLGQVAAFEQRWDDADDHAARRWNSPSARPGVHCQRS